MNKQYKYYFDVILCDKMLCAFIRGCDLGIDEYGTKGEVSFISDAEPTQENIDKIISILYQAKYEKSLNMYYGNITLNRVEVVLDK